VLLELIEEEGLLLPFLLARRGFHRIVFVWLVLLKLTVLAEFLVAAVAVEDIWGRIQGRSEHLLPVLVDVLPGIVRFKDLALYLLLMRAGLV
jgi:hypothetical protein